MKKYDTPICVESSPHTQICISHYNDVIMSAVASQITSVSIVCSIVASGADQRKHQSSASLAFVRGIHRSPVISPHKRPATRKMFPFDDVIMIRISPSYHLPQRVSKLLFCTMGLKIILLKSLPHLPVATDLNHCYAESPWWNIITYLYIL